MKNERVKPKVGNVLFNILAIITVISVGFVAFNIFSGAKGYAVTSDSMAETLHRGDLVFSRKAEFAELDVGDVVTVGSKELEEYFTHRIVAIDRENQTITTRGDNNPENDPMSTPADRIVGAVARIYFHSARRCFTDKRFDNSCNHCSCADCIKYDFNSHEE